MLLMMIVGALSGPAAAAKCDRYRGSSTVSLIGASAVAVSGVTAFGGGLSDNPDLIIGGFATMPLGVATAVIGGVGLRGSRARCGEGPEGVFLLASGLVVASVGATWWEYSSEGAAREWVGSDSVVPMLYTGAGLGLTALGISRFWPHRQQLSLAVGPREVRLVGRF